MKIKYLRQINPLKTLLQLLVVYAINIGHFLLDLFGLQYYSIPVNSDFRMPAMPIFVAFWFVLF